MRVRVRRTIGAAYTRLKVLRMRLNCDITTLRAGNPADPEATGALDAGA
jgi:hypothetical protein